MFDNIGLIFTSLMRGLPATVLATVGGIALTVVLSFVAGLALLAPSRTVRFFTRVYVEGFRGTSEVVQLFWIVFVLPVLVGFEFIPLVAGIIVLGLNHGAYGAEIVRGAVQAVPQPQHEGAIALSLGPVDRMVRVVLPQAVVEMLPSFNNLFIQLLKGTALLYFISAGEITERGQLLAPALPISQLVPIYVLELLIYLLLAVLITIGMRWLERVGARKLGRRPARRGRSTALAGTAT
ncbi:amino acid ABC transporter permease [Saccharomonospora saliphila]|uniref:amino acid ABC transporter permease n=1 Tax=Saccharomonospora saliphila TaxID=369829 RepID=UPI000376733D|nr:amino acid ABC transporter permease [Saccharomonospora saliphila]